jgi:hypothetical protein
MFAARLREFIDAFNIQRSLASRTRRCPGASTLMAEVDMETRMPGITSL